MYKLIVQVTKDSDPSTKQTECLGVFNSMEAAMAAGRRDILRYSEDENTNVEIKNHLRGKICSCGSVFKFQSAKSIEFKEIRHYWAEEICLFDANVRYAQHLYEDKDIEKEYPELNALLLKYIMDNIKKELAK